MMMLLVLFLVMQAPVHATDTLMVVSPALYTEESGIINIGDHAAWRFYPGDDTTWADPAYSHDHWYHIRPAGMTEPLPDSLWPGYGWFRTYFLATPDFYEQPWNLYFFTWGAAEVYIDGARVQRYGTFSTDPQKEVRYSPSSKLDRPVVLTPRDTHLVAVRLSYHPAERYKKIMGDVSGNFGFGIGFTGQSRNDIMRNFLHLTMRVTYIAAAVLLIITLMHGYLFYLFREERANLYIAVITSLLLVHSIVAFPQVHFELDRLWTYISGDISFLTFFLGAVFLIPYTVVQIFNLEGQARFKHLLWLILPLFITGLYNIALSLVIFVVSAIIVLSSTLYLLVKAYKLRKRGIGFVAFGFIGLMVLVFVVIGYGELAENRDWTVEWILIIMIYLIVPVSMTLMMSYKMAYLYTGMESMVKERTEALEKSLIDLQTTQNQLVQQEKLASLGQLTAGIAHEIKNPLNFVNNFSSVSIELVDEVRSEVEGMNSNFNIQDSELVPILDDIKSNLTKIHEHGSRADNIVKSMLQHARGGTGQMEPTNLNALVKEYVNLAFHSMRAGKHAFDVKLKLDLDETIGEIPLIAEDFSRVILNLCNNAFDAMREKSGETSNVKGETEAEGRRSRSETYVPKLTVRTKFENRIAVIEIEDNGPGIPDDIKDKIMQPFYTTKRGTEGTGLGLSITHDIIKAHGGELLVNSEPGNGAVFTIILHHTNPK